MLKIKTCHRQNTCVNYNNNECLHAGNIEADCPKYHCDNKIAQDCKNCEFIKQHIAAMRKEYQSHV